jgi:uncharacterized repeat protein (TIGR03809 family)
MAEQIPRRMPDQLALRWFALAERRRVHCAELYRSGRWKLYYTEAHFRQAVRATVAACEAWRTIIAAANIAPLASAANADGGFSSEPPARPADAPALAASEQPRAAPAWQSDHAAGSFAARLAALSQQARAAAASARSDPAFESAFDAPTSPLARRLAGGHTAWKSR